MKGMLRRLIRGNSGSHLTKIAELLGAEKTLVEAMNGASGEATEAMFLEWVENRHGCPIDWRETFDSILESLTPFLRDQELRLAQSAKPATKTPQSLASISEALEAESSKVRLRAMESLGDFYIVVIVPQAKIENFDEIAKNWLI